MAISVLIDCVNRREMATPLIHDMVPPRSRIVRDAFCLIFPRCLGRIPRPRYTSAYGVNVFASPDLQKASDAQEEEKKLVSTMGIKDPALSDLPIEVCRQARVALLKLGKCCSANTEVFPVFSTHGSSACPMVGA